MVLSDQESLKIFTSAFSDSGSCSVTCSCGTTFYDASKPGAFEEDEIYQLRHNVEAVALQWPVEIVEFEGGYFVADCDCWKTRALQLINFIDAHDHKIAAYLNARREAAFADAKALPEVASA